MSRRKKIGNESSYQLLIQNSLPIYLNVVKLNSYFQVTIYENNTVKARYNVLEEVKDLGLSLPFLFTVRDLDVTVTEIKPG